MDNPMYLADLDRLFSITNEDLENFQSIWKRERGMFQDRITVLERQLREERARRHSMGQTEGAASQ